VTRSLRCRFITGRESEEERTKTLAAYNAGKLDVLFVSKAGQQGCNLLGTRSMYQLDVHSNLQGKRQTDGRVVRMNSHPDGHAANVDITMLVSRFPSCLTGAGPARVSSEDIEVTKDIIKQIKRGDKDTPTAEEVIKGMKAVICADPINKQTVNEDMMQSNQTKHRKVQNLLNVLQRASIPMPRGTMGFALKAGAKPVNVKSRVQTVKTHCKVRWQSWAPKELKATTFSSFVTKAMTKVLEDNPDMLTMPPKRLAANATFLEELQLGVDEVLQEHVSKMQEKVKAPHKASRKPGRKAEGGAKAKPKPKPKAKAKAKAKATAAAKSKPKKSKGSDETKKRSKTSAGAPRKRAKKD
jgi:superfamily II DNA/RNA helicase